MRGLFVIQLTEAQLNIVSQALGAQPYSAVAALVNELQRQITEQQMIDRSTNGARNPEPPADSDGTVTDLN
jgi:hypothetical protein